MLAAPDAEPTRRRASLIETEQKETSLASVLERMLRAPDAWVGFADRYLDALDQAARNVPARPQRFWDSTGYERDRRTADLAEWHGLLLERLIGRASCRERV